jgi:hypothetical protein
VLVVGIWDLKGDFETRLLFLTCLKLDELRRATCGWRTGDSRFAMRGGDTLGLPGSGGLDSWRSRSGRGEAIVADKEFNSKYTPTARKPEPQQPITWVAPLLG